MSLGGSSLYTSTKQMRINIYQRNKTKNTVQTVQTKQIQVHILPKHPRITKQVKPTTVQFKTKKVQDRPK